MLDEHHLKAGIELGDDVSDTDLFCMMRGLRAQRQCMTLSVSLLRADSPARLTKSADEDCRLHSVRGSLHRISGRKSASLRTSNLALPLVICGLSLESRSINRSLRTDKPQPPVLVDQAVQVATSAFFRAGSANLGSCGVQHREITRCRNCQLLIPWIEERVARHSAVSRWREICSFALCPL